MKFFISSWTGDILIARMLTLSGKIKIKYFFFCKVPNSRNSGYFD